MTDSTDKPKRPRRKRRPAKSAPAPNRHDDAAPEFSAASLVKPPVRELVAYQAKDIPCKVKLDANESPFGFKLAQKPIATNRYPDPEVRALRTALAKLSKVSVDQVLTGNGSDELLYYLITAFGGPVLFPTPTFSMYGIIARALGEQAVDVPLDGKFDLDMNRMMNAIDRHKPKIIFLASPNNPTGNSFSPERVARIVKRAPGLVVIDEAYIAFSPKPDALKLAAGDPRVVILRTLSKIGLAALRVGYMIAREDIVAEVNKVRLPYNINALSQLHAAEALKDRAGLKLYVKAIAAGRAGIVREIAKLKGVTAYPTDANFVMFKVDDAPAVHAGLLRRGVLVRMLGQSVPGCLRVTVGSEKENAAFIKALKETVKEAPRGQKS